MIKKSLLGIVLIILIGLVWMHDLVWYGYQQGKGQMQIVLGAVEVSEILKDPNAPDSLKEKLCSTGVVRESVKGGPMKVQRT